MTPRLACATFTKFPLFFDKTGMFRVLCVSDLHARDGKWDPRLKLSLDALIRAHRPHLVFLLGDICHDGGMGSDALLHAYLADIMELCETERIPWAHIPGNHDRADTIPTEVFTAFPMNLSRRGPTELSGYGTFALPIWRHDGSEPAAMVWAFDSHTGIGAYAEYLCPCSGCELDTQWRLSPDGASVICTNCGAVKMRRWYDENKVRRK